LRREREQDSRTQVISIGERKNKSKEISIDNNDAESNVKLRSMLFVMDWTRERGRHEWRRNKEPRTAAIDAGPPAVRFAQLQAASIRHRPIRATSLFVSYPLNFRPITSKKILLFRNIK
jgi:hypothetical protein